MRKLDFGSREPIAPEDSNSKLQGQADLPEVTEVPEVPGGRLRIQPSKGICSQSQKQCQGLAHSFPMAAAEAAAPASSSLHAQSLISKTLRRLLCHLWPERFSRKCLSHQAGVGLLKTRAQVRVVCPALPFQQRERFDRSRIWGAGKRSTLIYPQQMKGVRHRVEKRPVQGHKVM